MSSKRKDMVGDQHSCGPARSGDEAVSLQERPQHNDAREERGKAPLVLVSHVKCPHDRQSRRPATLS